ncbi:MAG TPA: protease pro-enzyme activation domain-containing protein [Nevskiaceae bacterium]|nr:protease pro-enzyme activation domain-containing protein [Nevskiaceae bacterium]
MKKTNLRARGWLASLLLLSGMLGYASAHAAAGWVSTASKGLKIAQGVAAQPVAAGRAMHIALALKPRNAAGLKALATAVNTPGNPAFGHFLTSAQFNQRYAPDALQAQAVVEYLQQAGFTGVQLASNRMLVTASGTASQVQAAFNTTLRQFARDGRSWFVNTRDAQVPAALGGVVAGVYGLNNVEHVLPARRQTALGLPNIDGTVLGLGLSPQELWAAYNVGNTAAADQTTIAILAFGNMDPVIANLRSYEQTFGLPQVTVDVIPTGSPDHSTDQGEDEWDMDTQTSTGMAGNVQKLVIYDGGDFQNNADHLDSMNRFVADNIAKAASYSVSSCEVLQAVAGDMDATDAVLMQAAAQGQSFFTSTGDTGATCYDPYTGLVVGLTPLGSTNGVPDSGIPAGQAYPASSPWAVGVGGTSLALDSTNARTAEISWNAGGGGPSLIEVAPQWQTTEIVPSAVIGQRGTPDLAMDADSLVSGAAVFTTQYGELPSGGTSLSSPLALGAWARVQSASCNGYGLITPLIYQLAQTAGPATAVPGFYDIVAGTNGAFFANPGWDYNTGVGAFNVAELITALPGTGACSGGASSTTMTATPASVSFGSETVHGTSSSQTVTLANTGISTLNISSVSVTGDYTVASNGCTAPLPAGGSCAIGLAFKPNAAGTRAGVMTVAAANAHSAMVHLTGNGKNGPLLSLAPAALDFGTQPVMTASAPQHVTLKNIGTANLSIDSILVSSARSPDDFSKTSTCGKTLLPHQQCTLSITFKPLLARPRSGNLRVVSSSENTVDQVTLTGTGTQ